MTYTRKRGMSDAQDAIASYDDQIEQLNTQKAEILTSIDEVKSEQEVTRFNLARGILSGVNSEEVHTVSKEVGALHLPSVLAKCHEEKERHLARIEEIEASDDFKNADSLIDLESGTLTQEANEYRDLINETNKSISYWENAPYFLWVKKDMSRGSGIIAKFISAITFAWFGRERKYEECKAVVGPLTTAFENYDKTQQEITQLQSSNAMVNEKINAIKSLLQEHRDLMATVAQFEPEAHDTLLNVLAEHFYSADLVLMKNTIRTEAIPMLAKLEALRKKVEHLKDQKVSCDNEIKDRQERKAKVQNVLMKWQHSSKRVLSGDKSKWLVDVPSNCQRRTTRFCRSYSSQREIIVGYDNYNAFSALFVTGMVFSSFEVFAFEHEVDGYVANQIYSEASAIAETPDDMVLDTAATAAVMSENLAMIDDSALDMEQSEEDFADES